jgi:hypothetical protein
MPGQPYLPGALQVSLESEWPWLTPPSLRARCLCQLPGQLPGNKPSWGHQDYGLRRHAGYVYKRGGLGLLPDPAAQPIESYRSKNGLPQIAASTLLIQGKDNLGDICQKGLWVHAIGHSRPSFPGTLRSWLYENARGEGEIGDTKAVRPRSQGCYGPHSRAESHGFNPDWSPGPLQGKTLPCSGHIHPKSPFGRPRQG